MTGLPSSSIELVLAAALAASPAATSQEAQVTTVDPVMLRDGSAKGMVVRLSFPSRGRDLPVVILSHGNRLSREDYRPLVAALARAGYLVVQPDPSRSAELRVGKECVSPCKSRWSPVHSTKKHNK